MKQQVRFFLSLLILILALCTPAFADESEPFPHYPEIQGNVTFWEQVFGVWSMGQVAVHDLEYPQIVYEVVDLPGDIESRYTKAQLTYVEDLQQRWQKRLKAVAKTIAAGNPLTDEEKDWALQLTEAGGSDAVRQADERIRTQRGMRERYKRGLEISYRYDALFRKIFREAGLPEDIAYLPHVESSFQFTARSSANAVGMWQFTRGTGRRFMSVTAAYDERLDPITAARGAASYLATAYKSLGDWPLALTAYNHGVAGMRRAQRQHGGNYVSVFKNYRGRLFGFASKNFYAEFLAARNVAQNADSYFPEGHRMEPVYDLDSITLETRSNVKRLATAYGIPREELAKLNPAWTRHATKSGYSLPKRATIWLPAGTLQALKQKGHEPDYRLAAGDEDVYIVQPGDTLSDVARAHGMALSSLRNLNGLSRTHSLIRVGQKLLVAGAGASTHVVRRGETLSQIAQRYGMRIADLRSLNGIPRGSSLIRVGQKLQVGGRAESPKFHIVRSGDSLIQIAFRHGLRLRDLLKANGLTERSIIHPGERLKLPG